MNTILVLTDFSKNARNAANAALLIAGNTSARIILHNCYQVPVRPADVQLYGLPDADFFKKKSDEALARENERIDRLIETLAVKPGISYLNSEGSLTSNVNEIIKSADIDLIMMGGRDEHRNYFLIGSDVDEVINHFNIPVLIYPKEPVWGPINDVVFTTDFAMSDIKAMKYLVQLGEILKFQVYTIHVTEPEPVLVPDLAEEEKEAVFLNTLCNLDAEVSYKSLPGNDIITELEKELKAVHADVLAMVHKKHSFLWRLFNGSISKKIIKRQTIPILIIPENLG